MEEKKISTNRGVSVGIVLSPGSYKIEGEVMLLRVRLNGTAILCLIDCERRVMEIIADPAADPDFQQAPKGEVAFDASRTDENRPCPENEIERRKYAEAVDHLAGKFEAVLQRFAADSRACLKKMAAILDRRNFRLTCEYRDGARRV